MNQANKANAMANDNTSRQAQPSNSNCKSTARERNKKTKKQRRIPLAVHENVPSFPNAAFENWPGKIVHRIEANTFDVGFGLQTARRRSYHLIIDEGKHTGVDVQKLYDAVREEFAELRRTLPAAVFMVGKEREQKPLGPMQRKHLKGFKLRWKLKFGKCPKFAFGSPCCSSACVTHVNLWIEFTWCTLSPLRVHEYIIMST